jgi:hypothetical protein
MLGKGNASGSSLSSVCQEPNPGTRPRGALSWRCLGSSATDLRSVGSQVTLMPGAWPTARLGRASRDEPALGQHLLRRDVVIGGRCSERAQAVPRGSEPAQFSHGGGRHATTRDLLRDPVPEFGGAVLKLDQVEPAEHRAILADEHVEDADASLLLGQQGWYSSVNWS